MIWLHEFSVQLNFNLEILFILMPHKSCPINTHLFSMLGSLYLIVWNPTSYSDIYLNKNNLVNISLSSHIN